MTLKISVWDELDMMWGDLEITLPDDKSHDPVVINHALDMLLTDRPPEDYEESGDGWLVEHSATAGPILTIVSRNDRGHLSIIIVNYEQQG